MADGFLLAAAFSAGIVTFFSPCATAILPAYLTYYLVSGPFGASDPGTEPPSRVLVGGLIGAILGVGLLIAALVDRVLSFGDRGALDASVGLAGGFVLAIGAYVAWDAARALEPVQRNVLGARVLRGLVVGGVASLGVATIYMAIGLAFNLGLSRVPSVLPWVAFGSAIAIVALGVLLLADRNPLAFVPGIKAPRGRSLRTFYLFGAGYALIASGCFLPVFALVVGAALAVGFADAVQVMLAYTAGSVLVLLLVSASAGAAENLVFQALRTWRRHVHRIAGIVVIAMGAYVLWYDWTFLLSRGL